MTVASKFSGHIGRPSVTFEALQAIFRAIGPRARLILTPGTAYPLTRWSFGINPRPTKVFLIHILPRGITMPSSIYFLAPHTHKSGTRE